MNRIIRLIDIAPRTRADESCRGDILGDIVADGYTLGIVEALCVREYEGKDEGDG